MPSNRDWTVSKRFGPGELHVPGAIAGEGAATVDPLQTLQSLVQLLERAIARQSTCDNVTIRPGQ